MTIEVAVGCRVGGWNHVLLVTPLPSFCWPDEVPDEVPDEGAITILSGNHLFITVSRDFRRMLSCLAAMFGTWLVVSKSSSHRFGRVLHRPPDLTWMCCFDFRCDTWSSTFCEFSFALSTAYRIVTVKSKYQLSCCDRLFFQAYNNWQINCNE